MASGKKKPAKLRHELEEYTSLIRTLHTTSTQDIIPHLTGGFIPPASVPASPSRKATTPPETPGVIASDSENSNEDGRSRSPERKKDRKGKKKDNSSELVKAEKMYKDIWTRWPLLKKNVYIPEWSLQDEVKSIAEKAVRKWIETYAQDDVQEEAAPEEEEQAQEDDDASSSESSTEEDEVIMEEKEESEEPESTEMVAGAALPFPEEELITKGVVDGLSLEASNLLEHIFGVLAAHRPAVDASLQNRLGTMDWRTSLNVIGSTGVVDDNVLLNVQERMERIYGGSEIQISDRSSVQRRAKRKVMDLEESLGERVDPFHFEDDPKSNKRRRIKRK